jgi:hypothetical protein
MNVGSLQDDQLKSTNVGKDIIYNKEVAFECENVLTL